LFGGSAEQQLVVRSTSANADVANFIFAATKQV